MNYLNALFPLVIHNIDRLGEMFASSLINVRDISHLGLDEGSCSLYETIR